jgi:ribonuclease HI
VSVVQPDPLLRAAGPDRRRPAVSGQVPEVLHAHIDGASRGNPGEAGFGIHVTTPEGREVARLYGYLGRATNNVAEYQALIHALRYARARGARELLLFSDSELVVKQIGGQYRVKHKDMLPLHREAAALLRHFERASLWHVRREQNREADRLANQALDEQSSKLE